jgi:ubiquinone/menaquinone biosynthesis C-methylase UbiE
MDWTQRINEMAWGYKDAAILLNSLRVGIFEALDDRWLTPAEVAGACGLDERACDVVMHALAASGVLLKEGDRFATEPEARSLLLADSPTTLKSILGHNLFMMRNWAHLEDVLRSGEPVRRQERDEQQMRDFICGMENVSRQSSREVAARIDLSGVRRLLDLGGGPGTAAITFAREHPDMECVVFDLEGPVGIGRQQIEKAGLTGRIATVAGDFHTDPIPGGFDVVYISNIIHMMDAEHTLALLRKGRQALREGGRLLLKDFFLEDSRTEPASGAQFSVNMLVNTRGGKTYTRREALDLLTEAGLGDFEIIDVARQSQVIVAHPVVTGSRPPGSPQR